MRILDTLFPVFWILLAAFVVFKRRACLKSIRENPASRMVLFLLGSVLTVRLMLFMAGVPYQGRYLHPLLILAVFPAASGLLALCKYVEKFSIKRGTLVIVLLAGAICVGKALNPPKQKKWLVEIPELIKERAAKTSPAVLIATTDDPRISYYSGAEYHLFKLDVNLFDGAEAFEADAELNPVRDPDKIITDAFRKTSHDRKESFNVIVKLKKPERLKYFDFTWNAPPEEKIDMEVLFSPDDNSPFESAATAGSTGGSIILAQEKYAKRVLFTLKCGENTEWSLRGVLAYGFDSYRIFTMGQRENDPQWTPDKFAPGFESLEQAVRKWGGDNVFVLIELPFAEIEEAWRARNLSPPLKLIGEFRSHKKEPITLFQGQNQ
jgi:hypothetical protein